MQVQEEWSLVIRSMYSGSKLCGLNPQFPEELGNYVIVGKCPKYSVSSSYTADNICVYLIKFLCVLYV